MSAHALLGPSSAKRWMACPPSARESESVKDSSSVYAEEGTAAHELAELYLLCQLGGNDGGDIAKIKAFEENNEYYCGEMQEAVDLYLDIVNEKFAAVQQLDPSAMLMPEQRFDFSDWVPEGFGTGDATIIGGGVIEVLDYKHGKGVPVDAVGNPQLRLYGLGAWNTYKILYDIHTVRMTVVQPRLGSVTTDEMSVADLLEWAENEVKPRAQMAWKGEGEHKAGDHCKFCNVAPRCKALRDYSMEMAKHDFVLPNRLTDQDISDILEKIDTFNTWVKAVKEYALDQAENHGAKWPGWKLVEGRSNRKITDTDEAVRILKDEAGISEPLLYKPREVLGITALEKLVGKKKFSELLDEIIEKPPGKPTLVTESDKRPELNTAASAAADFS